MAVEPYDIRMPDILGQYYRGKVLDFASKRAPIEAQQHDQTFSQQQKEWGQQDEDREADAVGNMAGLLSSAPVQHRAAMYAQMKPRLASFAQKHSLPLPEVWDESYLDEVTQLHAMLGKGQQRERFQNLGDGYIMDGQGNVSRAFTPEAKPEKPEWGYIPDPSNPENEVYAERRGGQFFDLNGQPLYGGGNAPQTAPAGRDDVIGQLLSLGDAVPGAEPTSGLRSPAHNAEVGGKANSQHLAGTGMDYKIPPQHKARFMAMVAKNPDLMAIDEGDHIHVQQRRAPASDRKAPPATSALPGSRPRYKPGANREGLDAKGEMQLRKEYQENVDEPMKILGSFANVQSAGSNPSAAGDLSMIFAYMKILDPNSVVREQEFANAQNAAGVPDRVRNVWNKALRGERLNPNQRADFINHAGLLAKQATTKVDRFKKRYSELANQYGMAPERIVFSPYDEPEAQQAPAAAPAQAGPQPGDIEDGYQFKGGNPSDPKNWVKANP